MSVGHGDDLEWLEKVFETRFEINPVLGPDPDDTKAAKILNGIITVDEAEYTYEAGARRSELFVKAVGLQETRDSFTHIRRHQ